VNRQTVRLDPDAPAPADLFERITPGQDDLPDLYSIRTPRGAVSHLVADREGSTLCGRSHGINPRYINREQGQGLIGAREDANCGKCAKVASC
jgi:hypothetical protein